MSTSIREKAERLALVVAAAQAAVEVTGLTAEDMQELRAWKSRADALLPVLMPSEWMAITNEQHDEFRDRVRWVEQLLSFNKAGEAAILVDLYLKPFMAQFIHEATEDEDDGQ